jgi:hypothetical protein
MKKEWIYRIVSPDSYENMMGENGEIKLKISWPFDWNVASDVSWKYAKELEKEYPGYINTHMGMTQLHISMPFGSVEDTDILAIRPKSAGVNDPFEGYIIDPKHGIEFNDEQDQIKARAKSIVSERWRAICFSRISATENEIELFIKQEVLKDNYGKNYKNYMYAELNEKNFAELLISASKLLSRIGVAIIKVHYFDRAGIEKKDVGGLVFPPHVGIPGSFLNLGGVTSFGSLESGDMKLTGEEADTFKKDIQNVIPFKYKPAYGTEQEIRLLVYNFDEWKNKKIELIFDNKNDIFKHGEFII